VAVVGLGWPGLRHLDAYLTNPAVEVVALCDANANLRSVVQREHQIECGFGDIESLLALDGLDAVSICTPNFLHEPMAIAALNAGKHVLCEKPLAATLAQGERIAAAARASNHVFMIALSRRYREDSRQVKAMVDAGELGQIYHAHTGWLRRRWNPSVRGWFLSKELSGGGPLIDLGVHMLDLALWFMGNPRAVSVSGSVSQHFGTEIGGGTAVDVEDMASAFVRLENGGTILLESSWYSYSGTGDHVYTRLLGTRGGAKLEFGAAPATPPVEVYLDHGGVPLVATPTQVTADVTRTQFSHQIGEFVNAIREGRQPASTIDQGLEILRILDAIYRSAAEGAEVRL
jgi:predicted dehydrogenase